MGYVYGLRLIGDSTVRYVGLTTRPLGERMSGHRHAALTLRDNRPVSRWIRKHGADSFEPIILHESGSLEELCDVEIRLIDELSTHKSRGGLNLTLGGEGSLGHIHPPGILKKIGDSNRGRKATSEQRARMSIAQLARPPISSETRAKMSASARARVRTPEQLDHIRTLGKVLSDDDLSLIKRMTLDGFTQYAIASRVGVSQGGVSSVQIRYGWESSGVSRRASQRSRAACPDRIVRWVRAMVNEFGFSLTEASNASGVGRSAVHRIASGQRYTLVV